MYHTGISISCFHKYIFLHDKESEDSGDGELVLQGCLVLCINALTILLLCSPSLLKLSTHDSFLPERLFLHDPKSVVLSLWVATPLRIPYQICTFQVVTVSKLQLQSSNEVSFKLGGHYNMLTVLRVSALGGLGTITLSRIKNQIFPDDK